MWIKMTKSERGNPNPDRNPSKASIESGTEINQGPERSGFVKKGYDAPRKIYPRDDKERSSK
jgi:hypothetical protein